MINFLNWLDGVLWGLPLVVLMVVTGVYFTVRSGFFQFRYFGRIWSHTIGTLFRRNADAGEQSREGMLSPFQAVATAVGGTVGFGNIAGVATAVAAGGPGAVFWMWATAALGMILKQVEVTLGLYYRRHKPNGDTYGGPTYYMELGLGQKRRWGKLWLIPGVIFALGIFSTFFVTSSTLTASQVVAGALKLGDLHIGGVTVEGIIIVGVGMAILSYIITGGGTRGVARTFTKLVPIMSVVYILMGIVMILVNITRVPAAVASIFVNAFTGTAAIGGFAGCAVSQMVRVGMARAVYSNEAGWGTSPMIHSSAKTVHPVEQGLWGSFEVFFDTFIICSITALSVILSGAWTDGTNGGTLALTSFAQGFGQVGAYLLAVVMVIFTVTTSGGWFTYYLAILEHIGRDDAQWKKILMKVFYGIRALPGLLWTIYLVKTNNQGFIWTVVDITSAIPTFVNVAVILILSGDYFRLLKDYKARFMGIGTTDESAQLFYEDEEEVAAL